MTLDSYFDVMMTLNDVTLWYVVFIRCECHKCMRLSVIQSDLRGYSCTNTMAEKWKDLKDATAFQIIFVYFKQLSVEKKNTALLRVARKYKFCVSFDLNKLEGP